MQFLASHLQRSKESLKRTAGLLLLRIKMVPQIVEEDRKAIIEPRLKCWKVLISYVTINGPFPPLELFKHAGKSFFSKNGNIDGATQHCSILRSSISYFNWYPRIVSQNIKSVAVNAHLLCRCLSARICWNLCRSSSVCIATEAS